MIDGIDCANPGHLSPAGHGPFDLGDFGGELGGVNFLGEPSGLGNHPDFSRTSNGAASHIQHPCPLLHNGTCHSHVGDGPM